MGWGKVFKESFTVLAFCETLLREINTYKLIGVYPFSLSHCRREKVIRVLGIPASQDISFSSTEVVHSSTVQQNKHLSILS